MNKVNSFIIAATFLSVTTVANAATVVNLGNVANVESTSISTDVQSSTIKRFGKFSISGKKVTNVDVNGVEANNSVSYILTSPKAKRFNKFQVSGKEVVEVKTAYKVPKHFISRSFTIGSNS